MPFDIPRRPLAAAAAVLAAAAIAGPAGAQTGDPPGDAAKAEMVDPNGERVGTVTVEATASGKLILNAYFHGLPEGTHGFHIHETGSCSPDFQAAGGHFAPHGNAHGVLVPDGPHAGDLPNIAIPQDREKRIQLFLDDLALSGDVPEALLGGDGTAVIVHRQPDDYETQPAGAAGDRIACGVLERVG